MVNKYQRKLGSKRAYHAMNYPYPCAATYGVRLRATGNGDQRRPVGDSGRLFKLLYIGKVETELLK